MPGQFRSRNLLRGHRFRQFREIEPQGHGLQIFPQTGEQLQCGTLIDIVPVATVIQCPFRPHQRLGAGGIAAAFPPHSPCNDRELPSFRGQEGENLVALLGLRLPQDNALGDDIGRSGHAFPPDVQGAAPPDPVMFPLDCQPCGKAYTPPVRQSCRTAASNVPIPYADLLLQLVCEFCRNSCVEKSARKKHIFAQQKWRSRLRVRKTGGQRLPFSGVLIRPGSRSSARNSHYPASFP